jgi:hypothetical protein
MVTPACGWILIFQQKHSGTLRARHFAGLAGSGSREVHADFAWIAI